MIKRFLRRFSRLENIPNGSLLLQGTKLSKRFERLEIGGNKIEFAITDKITRQEEASEEIVYYVLCPFCGKDNLAGAEFCSYCSRGLRSAETSSYQANTYLLIKCKACGSMNLKERRNCWVCGIDLYPKSAKMFTPVNQENIITLNIDGNEYKSTDKALPLDIKILMEKIRREGYSKETIDSWIQEKNVRSGIKREAALNQIEEVRFRLQGGSYRLIILLIVGVVVFFIIRLNFTLPIKFLNAASQGLELNMK
jgi:hypothetical protein